MVDMTTPTQIAADQLAYIGVPPSLYNQVDFVESTGWPPRAGCRSSPDFSPARVWARIDLTEWLVTSPHVFGPHRTNELATLASVGRTLRLAGEGSIVLWALDIIEPPEPPSSRVGARSGNVGQRHLHWTHVPWRPLIAYLPIGVGDPVTHAWREPRPWAIVQVVIEEADRLGEKPRQVLAQGIGVVSVVGERGIQLMPFVVLVVGDVHP